MPISVSLHFKASEDIIRGDFWYKADRCTIREVGVATTWLLDPRWPQQAMARIDRPRSGLRRVDRRRRCCGIGAGDENDTNPEPCRSVEALTVKYAPMAEAPSELHAGMLAIRRCRRRR